MGGDVNKLFCLVDERGDENDEDLVLCRKWISSSGVDFVEFILFRRQVSREHLLLQRLPEARPWDSFDARDATRPSSSSVSLPL